MSFSLFCSLPVSVSEYFVDNNEMEIGDKYSICTILNERPTKKPPNESGLGQKFLLLTHKAARSRKVISFFFGTVFVYVYCTIVGECLKSYGVLFVCGELVIHQLIVYELFAEIFARFILCGVNVTRTVHPGWQSMFTIAFYDQRTVVRSA